MGRAGILSAVFLAACLLVFLIAYAVSGEVDPALRNAILIAAVVVPGPLALLIAGSNEIRRDAASAVGWLGLSPLCGLASVALLWLATDAQRASPALLASAGFVVTLIVALYQLDQTRSH